MLKLDMFLSGLANGLLTGAVYALIALGLTLVYGVLHIINFAHGATLTAAMYAVYFLHGVFHIDPYVAIVALAPLYFMETKLGTDYPPALTHPEFFYACIGVALAWQVGFLILIS